MAGDMYGAPLLLYGGNVFKFFSRKALRLEGIGRVVDIVEAGEKTGRSRNQISGNLQEQTATARARYEEITGKQHAAKTQNRK